jgi:REP element-mobilizing transposase RayT
MRSRDYATRVEPIAFFLTWTAYGSWLSGDQRGWTDGRGRMMLPEPRRAWRARRCMVQPTLVLDSSQRGAVVRVIGTHCEIRHWALHAVNCRAQHVHVVVTAPDVSPDDVLSQLKAWASRHLKTLDVHGGRTKWWTEGGSKRWIYEETDLESVVAYVNECQDKRRP